MNELTIDGKTFISSKRAAEITGYAKDYVGQLCREGRIEARLVGRNWYILEDSVREHRFGKEESEAPAPGRKDAVDATAGWSAPRYQSETPSSIPTLSERLRDSEAVSELENGEDTGVLTDMQAAWQEWFAKKEQGTTVQEEATEHLEDLAAASNEEPEVVSVGVVQDEVTIEAAEASESDDTPTSVVESEEVPVTLHVSPQELQDDILDLSTAKIQPAEEKVSQTVNEIEEEENPQPSRKYDNRSGNHILVRTILVSLMLVAIVVTTIGTGLITENDIYGLSRISEIKYLAGVIEYYK